MSLKQALQQLTCCRCGKPATIGEMDGAIGSFLACSDECHAAELKERTETYADESKALYERKRARIEAIRAGEIAHPGFIGMDLANGPDATAFAEVDGKGRLLRVLEGIEAAGAVRIECGGVYGK